MSYTKQDLQRLFFMPESFSKSKRHWSFREGFRRFTWKLSLLLMSALSLSLRAFKSTSGRMDGPRVGMVVVGASSWVVSRCMGRSIPRSDFSLSRLSDLTANSFLQNLQNMPFFQSKVWGSKQDAANNTSIQSKYDAYWSFINLVSHKMPQRPFGKKQHTLSKGCKFHLRKKHVFSPCLLFLHSTCFLQKSIFTFPSFKQKSPKKSPAKKSPIFSPQ